jgi:hypothetical protein
VGIVELKQAHAKAIVNMAHGAHAQTKVLVHLAQLKILGVVGIVVLCNKHAKAIANGALALALMKVFAHLAQPNYKLVEIAELKQGLALLHAHGAVGVHAQVKVLAQLAQDNALAQ